MGVQDRGARDDAFGDIRVIGNQQSETEMSKMPRDNRDNSDARLRTFGTGVSGVSSTGSAKDELPLPFEKYSKLDIYSAQERQWATRLVVTSMVDVVVSLIIFSVAMATGYQ